jgi:antitoxin (DNA-binding transcriptional repressor) of toxin-antitoxin stability system
MQQIAISKFKATCLAVLEQVRLTGKPVSITRRGQVVAEINPPAAPEGERKLGWFRGELPIAEGELSTFSGWDGEDEKAWERNWDANELSKGEPRPSAMPRRRKR